jgi:hypothetical protein
MFPYWRFLPEGATKYHAYLRSQEWQVKRDAVAWRSGNRCEGCHRRRARDVHHLTYVRKYHEPLADLIHLCGSCHAARHSRRLSRLSAAILVCLLTIALCLLFL